MKRKFFWSMLTILMVTLLCVGFTSCGDDDDDDAKAKVVGTWKGPDGNTTVTMTFNSGGDGMYIESYNDSYSGGRESVSTSFTYSMVDAKRGIASIKVPDKWYSGSSTWTFYFIISDNTMSVYDDDFGDDLEFVLTKQK